MDNFAFLGTGSCDPNKDIKQFLAYMAVIVGWTILVILIRKLHKSHSTKATKVFFTVLLITAGIIGSAVMFLAVWLGLACSR